jgi:hypothetical protein
MGSDLYHNITQYLLQHLLHLREVTFQSQEDRTANDVN